MANNIDRIQNGLSAAGLAGIKEDVSTADLHALLANNWTAVADGRSVTDVEAAWLIRLANHPNADRALRVAIAARLDEPNQ